MTATARQTPQWANREKVGENTENIADNVQNLRERIARAEEKAGRPASSVRLVAVTKTVDAARVREVAHAGVPDVGENYIQEGREKAVALASDGLEVLPLVWHFIGHLQRNKARFAVAQYDLVHTIDNLPLAQEMGRQADKLGTRQKVLIEVRLGPQTENRAGIAPELVLDFAGEVALLPGLELRGLMAIAPREAFGNEAARPHFAQVRALWEQLPPENRHELSMGMTNDFEAAINEGATLIRIGTALFGRRDTQKPE